MFLRSGKISRRSRFINTKRGMRSALGGLDGFCRGSLGDKASPLMEHAVGRAESVSPSRATFFFPTFNRDVVASGRVRRRPLVFPLARRDCWEIAPVMGLKSEMKTAEPVSSH